MKGENTLEQQPKSTFDHDVDHQASKEDLQYGKGTDIEESKTNNAPKRSS